MIIYTTESCWVLILFSG